MQEHIPERFFSHYVNPNLLAGIYAAIGRKAGPPDEASESMALNNDDYGNDSRQKLGHDEYQTDQRRLQGYAGKSHAYAEEIDDNIDYEAIED